MTEDTPIFTTDEAMSWPEWILICIAALACLACVGVPIYFGAL